MERWQSGRMRVFAKDVTGQKLVHGFESRPLRWLRARQFRQPITFGSRSLVVAGRLSLFLQADQIGDEVANLRLGELLGNIGWHA